MEKTKYHSLGEQILNLFANDNSLYMGDIAKELSADALNVTKQVIELKRQGLLVHSKGSAKLMLSAL